jgi:hypothetical protein
MRAALVLLSAAILFAQDPGAIHGTVRDALTGTPLPNVTVRAGRTTVVTDPRGEYSFRHVPPGAVQVDVLGAMVKSFGLRSVTLTSGQDLALDLPVQALGRVAGAVMDADGKPVSDAVVTLATRQYSLGAIRYVLWYSSLTNSRGEFGVPGSASPMPFGNPAGIQQARIDRARSIQASRSAALATGPGMAVEAGRGYFLLASKGRAMLAADSEFEPDPAKRKPIPHVTWYIGAHTPEAAMPFSVMPAERREAMNIRMSTGPGYCILGTVRANALPGGTLQVEFAEAPMATQGILGHFRFEKTLNPDSSRETSLHICNLSPGDYRFTSALVTRPNTFPQEFRTHLVTITDGDLNLSLDGEPPVRASGEIAWDGDPPQQSAAVALQLRPLNHTTLPDETVTAKPAVPGRFAFDRLVADEFELQLMDIPSGAYLKDITCAGRSVLHQPLPAGSLGDLRITLARDGAHIAAQTDADTWVVAFPAGATTETAIADAMVFGRADSSGAWTSPLLAPGKYLVLSSPAPADGSVEFIDRLFHARFKAQELDLAPNSSTNITLK